MPVKRQNSKRKLAKGKVVKRTVKSIASEEFYFKRGSLRIVPKTNETFLKLLNLLIFHMLSVQLFFGIENLIFITFFQLITYV